MRGGAGGGRQCIRRCVGLPLRRRKDGFEVLGSDPDVFVGPITSCVNELDVHELVAELVKCNTGCYLGPVRGGGTGRIDDLEAVRRQDERSRTESWPCLERIDEECGSQDERDDGYPSRRGS
jgi:hypothetical protein